MGIKWTSQSQKEVGRAFRAASRIDHEELMTIKLADLKKARVLMDKNKGVSGAWDQPLELLDHIIKKIQREKGIK